MEIYISILKNPTFCSSINSKKKRITSFHKKLFSTYYYYQFRIIMFLDQHIRMISDFRRKFKRRWISRSK